MADAHTYDADGKGHRMLARLREAPATNADLARAACGEDATGRKRRAARFVIMTLIDDGFAWRPESGAVHITRQGLDALACLDAGHPVTVRAQAQARAA